MTVSVFSAAKQLGETSSWSLTNLEMQKILYLAHMFHLGRTNGEPLVFGHFEAWDYGPVHPDLYHRLKIFGRSAVQDVFYDAVSLKAGAERDIINEAYEQLGHIGAGRLVSATHRPNGAWHTNYVVGSKGCLIQNSEILQEFRSAEHVGEPR
ncbi:MAG: Panacea domain-containing protein [Rhabdaerophilum sp.]